MKERRYKFEIDKINQSINQSINQNLFMTKEIYTTKSRYKT